MSDEESSSEKQDRKQKKATPPKRGRVSTSKGVSLDAS